MSSLSDKAARLNEGKVLLVDDDEYVRVVVGEIISHWLPEIDGVGNGNAALEKLADKDYDFLLIDMRMPDMNGMELYALIKQQKPHLIERVVFLTGDTESSDVKGFFQMSGARCLAKPFAVEELIDTLLEMKVSCDENAKFVTGNS